MRQECISHKYYYGRDYPVGRLIALVGQKMQTCTQRYDRRPYGVGLLVAGHDETGPHIYQTCPSANFYDCKAMAIGARSQSARTYLEKHLNSFKDCSLFELINHGIKSLASTLPNETRLNKNNLSICVVGKDTKFRVLDEAETEAYINSESNQGVRGAGAPEAAADVGVGGNERRTREDAPAPNPQDPIPDVATEEDRRMQ